jgi:hypothetical protein
MFTVFTTGFRPSRTILSFVSYWHIGVPTIESTNSFNDRLALGSQQLRIEKTVLKLLLLYSLRYAKSNHFIDTYLSKLDMEWSL